MKKILESIHFEESVSVVFFIVMLTIAFINVIGRYCFHASISCTDEVTANLFVAVSLLGTALAARDRQHLSLSVLTDLIPSKFQRIISGIANLLGSCFGLVLFITGIKMVQNQIAINAKTITLQWPAWIYGIFLPIAAVFITIRFLLEAVEDFSGTKKKEKDVKGEE